MQTTSLETCSFSDAAAMTQACYIELLRAGFQKEAESLRGVEIFSYNDVQNALAALEKIEPTGSAAVDAPVRYAAAILRSVAQHGAAQAS